jgi:hypothetical protein
MEPFRLKLKIGPHEFEAEGAEESVTKQFEAWQRLIASPSASTPVLPSPPPVVVPPLGDLAANVTPQTGTSMPGEFDRLFRHEGRVVSLTILPDNQPDAGLLLLLGQRVYNKTDLVTGQQIADGLKRSGFPFDRVDRGWGEHLDLYVMKSGVRRAVTYRLTNPGIDRARTVAKELLEKVP